MRPINVEDTSAPGCGPLGHPGSAAPTFGAESLQAVSNPRVTIDGDTAKLEAMVEAQHVPRKDHSRHYLMKNRYDVDLVRHEGIWVIQRTTVDNVWRTGDVTVMSGV